MFAQLDRDQLMDKLNGGKIAFAEKGYSIGGKTPFGYEKAYENQGSRRHTKLVPIPEEQEVLKHIYALAKKGLGARRISKQIESSHPNFSHFPYHKVQRILNRKFQGLLDAENEKYDTP